MRAPAPSHDLDTLNSVLDPDLPPAQESVYLTVLTHPDPQMIGARVALPDVMAGRVASVSRLTPDFRALTPGRVEPLADPYISRQPILLSWRDGVVVTPSVADGRVIVAGEPLVAPRHVPAETLRPGVVIELSTHTCVLLHLRVPATHGLELGLVGHSEALDDVRSQILRAAQADVSVLLTGETGAGKELVARALHDAGPRQSGPWIAVNVAEIQAETAASVLFGHVRGAFTGATHDHEGLFARAHGGTLFLDEVGEMAQDVQAMLLRVLETGELQRLGDRTTRRVDVRVIAATDQVVDGASSLRSQVLYRLAGFRLHVPPLRDRLEDLGVLTAYFLQQELGRTRRRATAWLPATLMTRMATHRWPGNVRELRNLVRTMLIQADGHDRLGRGFDMDAWLGYRATLPPDGTSVTGAQAGPLTDDVLTGALIRNHWSMSATARDLGIARSTLYLAIDRSPTLRKAADISAEELRQAYEQTGGDVDAMAEILRASPRGIRLALRHVL